MVEGIIKNIAGLDKILDGGMSVPVYVFVRLAPNKEHIAVVLVSHVDLDMIGILIRDARAAGKFHGDIYLGENRSRLKEYLYILLREEILPIGQTK